MTSGAQAERDVELSNRVAVLTFLTAFAVIAALVALPRLLDGGVAPWTRVLAAVPSVVAAALVVAVRRARARLRGEGGDRRGPAIPSAREGALGRPR